MTSERYTLFAQDANGNILHVSETQNTNNSGLLTCVSCHTSLMPTVIQCQDSEAYYPVFEHTAGILCLQNHGKVLLYFAKQHLQKERKVKQPEYSQTLESVLTMVPGYPNRYYELPAQIESYPASVIHIDNIEDLPTPDSQTIACLIITSAQSYAVVFDIGGGFVNAFDVDESGRLPVMLISMNSELDTLLPFTETQLCEYILHTAPREWLSHPVHLDHMAKLRQVRYALSLERAAKQALTLNKLSNDDVIKVRHQTMTTEQAFCHQYHEELMGLVNYTGVTKDLTLLNEHKRLFAQAGIYSMSHYEKIASTFPTGLPLPYDKSYIVALYASQRVDMTLSGDNVYVDCYAVANWLVDALQVPMPLSAFISHSLFYCHDIDRWRDSTGLLGCNDQRQLLLPAKRLLIFIWKLSQYRPNSKVHNISEPIQ
ncbi:MAG: hypothetical protein ACI9JN_000986 [Bacteroidia bacterium]|jgi:hypothetical protein